MQLFLDELLSGTISNEGYRQFLHFIRKTVSIRRWPIIILGENVSGDSWNNETLASFAHQFLSDMIQKKKITCLSHIPPEARFAYMSMFLAQYAADQIRQHQQKSGFSYAQIKRCTKNILQKSPKLFCHQAIGSKNMWRLCHSRQIVKLSESEIIDLVKHLPKCYIKPDETRIDVYVKERLKDILGIADTDVEENVLMLLLYENLCQRPQICSSDFERIADEHPSENDIQENHKEKIDLILSKLDETDCKILKEYFFKTPDESLKDGAERLSIPKSTLHHRLNHIKSLISKTFPPCSEQDGLLFLEKLRSTLDDPPQRRF
jgi:hypothetical protein